MNGRPTKSKTQGHALLPHSGARLLTDDRPCGMLPDSAFFKFSSLWLDSHER